MQLHRGIYFTGHSSRAYNAMLSPRGEFLLISYLDESGEPVYVQWMKQEVKRLSRSGDAINYQYGSFPFQSLTTSDAEIICWLEPQSSMVEQQYNRLLNGGWRSKLGLAVVFLGILAIMYFFVVPGTAAFLAGQLPQQAEIDLGERLYRSMISGYHQDKLSTDLANRFAAELDFETDYPIQITVVRQNELNAFAMPGGHIVVYDKLLHSLETPEAFAALLGHEVAHVKYRHSLKSMSRALSNYLFLSFVLGDLNGVSAVLVDNADMLSRLNYSRELEQSADQAALELLAHNRLDQQGLVQLMEALPKSGEYMEPLRLLSSHPLTEDRIAFARENIQQQTDLAKHEELQRLWNALRESVKSSYEGEDYEENEINDEEQDVSEDEVNEYDVQD